MNYRNCLQLVVLLLALAVPLITNAQTKDVTVAYLRAATGSLPDHANVSFDALFASDQGLVEAQSWNLRGRGISRFSVKDPQSSVIFPNLYCNQDTSAFKELIKVNGTKLLHITGYKDEGEKYEPSIYVTSVEVLPTPAKVVADESRSTTNSVRIVLKDTSSGSKTVLVNVVPGKTYTVDNLTLTVELEKGSPVTEPADTQTPSSGHY